MYYTHTDSLTNSKTVALHDGDVVTYFTEHSPLYPAYLDWVAEGNEATEWTGN